MAPRRRHDGRHLAVLLAIPALTIATFAAWAIALVAAWAPLATAVSLAVTVGAVAAPACFLRRARRRTTDAEALAARP
jgi:hypothetical protein